MDFAFESGAIESVPSLTKLTSKGYPTSGNPQLGIPATRPGDAWFYAVTAEIVNAIKQLGGTPTSESVNQMAEALQAKFALKADIESPTFTGSVKVPDPTEDQNPITLAYFNLIRKSLNSTPTGAVIPFAGANIPDGYLLCNGAEVSRESYADLFSVIGTLYGECEDSSLFKLPDLRDRFVEGAGTNELATYLEAGLPNITGTISDCVNAFAKEPLGAFGRSEFVTCSISGSGHYFNTYYLDASRGGSSLYGNSTTVQPISLVLNQIIKY